MTTPPPLSPDAQAVSDAFAGVARGIVYNWEAGLATAIRAAVDRVVPEQRESPAGEGEPWPRDYQLMSDSKWEQSQQIRTELLAIAAELDGGNTTTTQETNR
jgi:hypothetical protein